MAKTQQFGATRPLYVPRLITILVVDIRDFTNLTQRVDQTLLCQAIGTWFRRGGAIMQAWGSWAIKYIGDAIGVPPPLPVYRERGHRRLAVTTYDSKCNSCIWGCAMPVEMIIDQWNPDQRRYRTETFCYGPLSCSRYKPGPTRKVPGRHGMTYEREDWVDKDATAHRGPDD